MFVVQTNSVRQNLSGGLGEYATQIERGATGNGWTTPLARSTFDAVYEAQVLAADGSVLASTASLAGQPAVYSLPDGTDQPLRLPAASGIVPDSAIVVGTRATVNGEPVVIITGTDTGILDLVTSEFGRVLLIGMPIILVLSIVAVWLIVGRALRPVEQIRRSVNDITSDDLSRRVPEPMVGDEIGQLALTMNRMLTRLEVSALKQRQFVADASHELRSPLAAIRTTLEVGIAHPDSAPWPVIAARAAEQSIRLETLLQQLLVLAKADEGELGARGERVDIAELIARIVASTRVGALTVTVAVTPGLAARGNAQDLDRLVRNIVDNAVRYASTTVAISACPVADTAVIEIVDDGPGIPAAERERVFERFVRLDSSRNRSKGNSGLGLSIAAEIAHAHGGQVHITESLTTGAHFVVVLPAATRDLSLKP
ncbi:sensor histidine kinase [Subtercola boreus]|nr:HAMP domain-containing sensor histidine kinase [Subtercola boreus]